MTATARILTVSVITLCSFSALALDNGQVRTPPMGWNSWNCCGGSNETQVKAIADAMASNGMAAAGYQYVTIDDGWATARDGSGNIGVNTTLFPSGIAALATYVHGKGLKFGIYTAAGPTTCQGLPGSYGHMDQDARQYAAWGVDLVKIDGCSSPQEQTTAIASALVNSGRPMVCSVNQGYSDGMDTVVNMWRISDDIHDNWPRITWIIDLDVPLWPLARPGHWNDADMLEVGNGTSMSLTEYRSHFAMWCMLAAPLLAGNNLTTMQPATRDILTQTELIAIDQDSLGAQARRVAKSDSLEVWVKLMADSSRAVALLNRGPTTARIGFSLARLGWWPGLECPIRDVCNKVDVGTVSDTFSDTVTSHGTAVFRVFKGLDHQGPRIVSVFNDTTLARVYVLFDEPLQPSSAQTAANYALSGGASVSSATLLADGRGVALSVSPLSRDTPYALTVSCVADRATSVNVVAAGTGATFTAAAHAAGKLTGTLFGAGDPFGGSAAVDYPAAVDGNLATYADLNSHTVLSPLFVGYDMGAGHEAMLTSVAYAPRNSLFASRMVGMHVQGSDDFQTWTTLYTVSASPAVGVLTHQVVTPSRPYRYIRLEGTAGFLNVAEVEFYGYDIGTTLVRAVNPAAIAGMPSRQRSPVRVVLLGSLNAAKRGALQCYDLRGAKLRNPGQQPAAAVLIQKGMVP